MSIFRRLADDVNLDLATRIYCTNRIKSEGLQFLTITLPKLSKAVLASLEKGYFDRPTEFAWKGRSLRYFRSLLDNIFGSDGRVLKNACAISIWRLRQLCEYFYKLALPFKKEVIEEAVVDFVEVDNSLADVANTAPWRSLKKNFETYYPNISRYTLDAFCKSYNRPRYGPGTFSGHTRYSSPYYEVKLQSKTVWGYLSRFEPVKGIFKPYPSAPKNLLHKLRSDTADFSELLLVPKDSRGPRTIVREPLHLLRFQMGFMDWVTDALEHGTSFRINFKSQETNRLLAMDSSKRPHLYSTLDLKSGSDRVSYALMKRVFADSPFMRYALSQRSNVVRLPDGRLHKLNKVAGMGSGLTFPLMALLIHLAICTEISLRAGVPYQHIMREVFVYGDDTIVPSKYYSLALSGLRKVGLMVNEAKSFRHSHFRESCGGDYYMGQSVAPVRLSLKNSSPRCISGSLTVASRSNFIVEINAHCQELIKGGMIYLAEYYYSVLENILGPLPGVSGDSPVIGRFSSWQSPSYEVDECGNHLLGRYYLPSVRCRSADTDPYIFLASKLGCVRDDNEDPKAGLPYGIIGIPRDMRLRKVALSSFRLG
jgi:hypothetical protein